MRRPRKRTLLIISVVLLAAIFIPPFISVGLFRKQLQTSISRSLNRQVTIGQTSPRLFPPGFLLQNVVIADDPGFSAEPMIRAEQMTASLRLTSLWRGRLEIAKLSLKYPSLNLVRSPDGRWNIEELLQRTSQVSAAPTARNRPEARPRFPYIESDTGRINFKFGNEKKAFALVEADFALWQESDNEWRVRLDARPMRTDMNLSDLGAMKLNARFQRARTMMRMPMEVNFSWEKAQLGQLTALFYGRDRGWRGDLEMNVVLSGTAEALNVSSTARLDDFRRYDIFNTDPFRLVLRCNARYSASRDTFSDGQCQLPIEGNGLLTARGTLTGFAKPRAFDLSFAAQEIPAQQFVNFLRHAKKNVPEDLRVTGLIQAAFTGQKSENTNPVWRGGGSTEGVVMTSKALERELTLGNIAFGLQVQQPVLPATRAKNARPVPTPSAPTRLAVQPFALPLDGEGPAMASASFSPADYSINLHGEADIGRVLQVARVFGITVPEANTEGKARLDVTVAGEWYGLPAPRPTGIIQVRGLRADIKGINAPLQLAGADIRLDSDRIRVENLDASFAGIPMNLLGSVSLPRPCPAVEQCPVAFDLRADQLSIGALNELVNPNVSKRPWYQIIGPTQKPESLLAHVQARGALRAARLSLGNVVVTKFASTAALGNGMLALNDVDGDVFGGHEHGEYRLDFSSPAPIYSGHGSVTAINVAQAASVLKANWGTGSADIQFSGTMIGRSASDLAASTNAHLAFEWRNGQLKQFAVGNNAPLRFSRFAGEASLRKGSIEFRPSRMQTPRGILEVSGTASLGRQLDLRVQDGSKAFVVTGTLENPKVGALPTQLSEAR